MKLIDKIEIHRFRSISDISIPVGEITVFSGINNSGKSNVLKALNLFFNSESSSGQEYDFEKDYNLAFTGQAGGKREIKITLFFSNQGEAALKKPFSISRSFGYGYIGGYEYASSDNDFNKKLINKDGNVIRQFTTFLNKVIFLYIPAVRDKNFVQRLFLHFEKLIEYDSGKDFGDKISELSAILKEKSEDISVDFEKFIELPTRAALSSKITDILGTVEINVKTGMKIRRRTKGVVNTEEAEINLFSSGDGILMSYLAYFLAHLSKRISNKMFIWGFEEPENSLEYSKVQKLSEEFYGSFRKNAQIFITTHSPAFINLKNKSGINFYRAYIEETDSKRTSKIKTLNEIKERQQSLFKSKEVDNDEYKKLSEELNFVEYAKEIELAVLKIQQEEENLLKTQLEFQRKTEELLHVLPLKIFICEDEDIRVIQLWKHLFELFDINDISILSSEGSTKNFIETGIRHQKKLSPAYNPKVFRQIDRDGLTDEQIELIKNKIFINEKRDLQYDFMFLPVNELENFAVIKDAAVFSDAFWNTNKTFIINAFEKTADDKCRIHAKNYDNNDNDKKFFMDSGSTTAAMQKMRDSAYNNWRIFFPGKEICKRIPNFNFTDYLKRIRKDDLPEQLSGFIEEIKIFFDNEVL
jgi:predicted ATPase